jgi:NADH-quinone oxidoreductase subunit C
MTTQELHDTVLTKLKAEFADAIVSSEVQYDFPVITVSKNKLYDILKFLKTSTELGFEFLTTACGIHYPDAKGKELGMVYQLHNMPQNVRIRIKSFTALSDVVFPSMIPLWPAANWMEREAFDFYGLRFEGHPNLIRILNM